MTKRAATAAERAALLEKIKANRAANKAKLKTRKPNVGKREKAAGWTWYYPNGGVITMSRPPTDEERAQGIQCPEVPGIWDVVKNTPVKYCPNDGSALDAEVDKYGNLRYFCRVEWKVVTPA